MNQKQNLLVRLFWRIYGSFWESYGRKQGIQSQQDEGGIYFIDRETGKPILGYNGENLNPPKKKEGMQRSIQENKD